jgi:hypothetical protein
MSDVSTLDERADADAVNVEELASAIGLDSNPKAGSVFLLCFIARAALRVKSSPPLAEELVRQRRRLLMMSVYW